MKRSKFFKVCAFHPILLGQAYFSIESTDSKSSVKRTLDFKFCKTPFLFVVSPFGHTPVIEPVFTTTVEVSEYLDELISKCHIFDASFPKAGLTFEDFLRSSNNDIQ